MKAKLDENLDVRLASILAEHGVDAVTVYSERLSGAPDENVFAASLGEERTLITLDLDFANPLRFPPAEAFGIVVLRARRTVLSHIQELLLKALPTLKAGNLGGKLWIVEPERIRVYDPRDHE